MIVDVNRLTTIWISYSCGFSAFAPNIFCIISQQSNDRALLPQNSCISSNISSKLPSHQAKPLSSDSAKQRYGITTKILAEVCHNCEICPFADKKPNSIFGKIMRWQRTWCPAWAAHTKIYGRKPST